MSISNKVNTKILVGLVALLGSVGLTTCTPSARVPIRGPNGHIENAPGCCTLLYSKCDEGSYCRPGDNVEKDGIVYATCQCYYPPNDKPASEGSPDHNFQREPQGVFGESSGNSSNEKPNPLSSERPYPD